MGLRWLVLLPFLAATIGATGVADPNALPKAMPFVGRQNSVTTYALCKSRGGLPGRWIPASLNERLTMPAYLGAPGAARSSLLFPGRPLAVQCVGEDGSQGVPVGTIPREDVLPAGSLISQYSNVLIVVHRVLPNGKSEYYGHSFPVTDDLRIQSDSRGISVVTPSAIQLFPAGSTMSVGYGESLGFARPGHSPQKPYPSADTCTITATAVDGSISTRTVEQDCFAYVGFDLNKLYENATHE